MLKRKIQSVAYAIDCSGFALFLTTIILSSLLSFTTKDTSMGLYVNYPRNANTGQEVVFSFSTQNNIKRIRVFVNGSSLGSAWVSNNKAQLKFKFAYPSTKKLKFVGLSSSNDSLSVLTGEITINKTLHVYAHRYEPNAYSNIQPAQDKIYTPNPSTTSPITAALVATSRASYLTFPATPSEDPVNGLNQNVYSTAIGHPSIEDANNFLREIQPEVVSIARKYNVPASIIMAMAALESGYGYSRTAVYANNFFGLKQWKSTANAYQLKGQPDEHNGQVRIIKTTELGQHIYDESIRKDNWYRSFRSRSDCIRFLVEEVFLHKTELWKRDYSSVARFYQRQINSGVSKSTAAYNFAYMLGERGYTHLGGRYYAEKTMKIVSKYNLIDFD
jgi:flagellum-specific peptidoglycan hydrolase FlgJ